MCVALRALNLGALHAERIVSSGANVPLRERRPETGPARPRVELLFGTEKVVTAADATVESSLMVVPKRAGVGWFCCLLSCNCELGGRKYLLPLGIGIRHLAQRYWV